jgi:hypothetical protein
MNSDELSYSKLLGISTKSPFLLRVIELIEENDVNKAINIKNLFLQHVKGNILDKEFLRNKTGCDSYTERMAKYYDLNTKFIQNLYEKSHSLSQEDYDIFLAKFRFLKSVSSRGFRMTEPPIGLNEKIISDNYLNEFVFCKSVGDNLQINKKLVAKRIGRFLVYHTYVNPKTFSGVLSELVCQIPQKYKQSTEIYLLTKKMGPDNFRYDLHQVIYSIYQFIEN